MGCGFPPQGISALLKEALVVYKGVTTSAGAAGGTTLVCSDLTSKADWNGNQVIVTSGDYEGQARDINGVTTGGTITPATAFSGQIASGVTFVVTGIRTVPAEVAECLAILESDSRRILTTALTAPTVSSLTKFIASGGTALGTTLGASKSLIDALGVDGVDALSHDFSEEGLMQYAHGKHLTTYILFIIPEAVASISAHNTAIKASLEKLGRVLTITQADALSYPDFNTYTLCVLGSNNGTAWTTSNLAHIKELSDMPTVCCDSASAAYLEMGTANTNVTTTKALFGVANIEGSIVGMGLHGRTGLAVGTQDIADANTTFASLDMSDVDITEVYYGYETSDDNAHVLLGKIRYIQPDGTIGVDEEGEEIPGSRYFYGPAYSFNDLNTLGQDAFEILVLGLIHSKTIGHSIALSGEIRSLEKVLFGNLKNKFSNSNPLAKFIGTGGTALGQPLPASTSLIDLLGNFTGPYNGSAQDDNVKASLDLAHTDLDSIIADIAALNNITAANVWETNISAYSGAGYAGTYLKTLYDDWLNGGRLDLILDAIASDMDRQEHKYQFRSDMQASATLTDAGSADISLPSVTIPSGALPTGYTIDAVYCHFVYGSRRDTSTDDNAIDGDQYIQVEDNGSPGYTNAVKVADNSLPIDISQATIQGGTVFFGNIDVSAVVDADNKTFNFQWTNCKVDGNNMVFNDIYCIIEVRWH
jgi:hypothetical protein